MPRTKKTSAPKSDTPDTLIYPNGRVVAMRPLNGVSYTLEELYRVLECNMVEVVHTQVPDTILICDEEGCFVNNPVRNVQASNLAGVPIVGIALVCHTKRFK